MSDVNMYSVGRRVEVDISDLAEGGASFGRLENGLSVFVDGLLVPGDRALVELTQVKKRQARGRLVELLVPAADRVEAPCGLFGSCGGCRWQSLPYDRQLALKEKLVRDALVRIGGFAAPNLLPIVASADPFRYRNKVEFVFSDVGYALSLGLHRLGDASQVLDVPDCLLLPEGWRETVEKVRVWARGQGLRVYDPESKTGCLRSLVIREGHYTGERMVVLVTGSDEVDEASFLELFVGDVVHTVVHAIAPGFGRTRFDRVEVLHGSGTITEHFLGVPFRVSPSAFLQPNTLQAEGLYARALEWAQLSKQDRVVDLYCGIGTLSLLAAKKAGKVTGLEVSSSAVQDAQYNAEMQQLNIAEFKVAHLGKDGVCVLPSRVGVVLADPPRGGMHPAVVKALRELAAERIVYISCKPSSLARDVKRLCEGGLYELIACEPFDQFPQTDHVECVALLVRGGC